MSHWPSDLGLDLTVKGSMDLSQQGRCIISAGTLFVAIAATDGLVLASDSRLTVETQYCDGIDKFVEPRRPDRTVIFLTGRRGVWPRAISSAPDVCAYVRRAKREFDLAEVARDFLEAANVNIDQLDLSAAGKHCATALRRHLRRRPDLVLPATEHLTEIIFAAYDPASSKAIIRSVALAIDSSGLPLWRGNLERRLGLDDAAEPVIAGESNYFNRHVLPTFLDNPLNVSTRRFWALYPRFPKVRNTSRQIAVDAAIDIIEATSRMTLHVPASSGIGGPVIIRILGTHARPITWRNMVAASKAPRAAAGRRTLQKGRSRC